MDGWFDALARGLPAGWSIVATGGYANGLLCPGSDVDVVLIHPQRAGADEVRSLAEPLWYPMWNAGVKLSPSAHSVKSLLALASPISSPRPRSCVCAASPAAKETSPNCAPVARPVAQEGAQLARPVEDRHRGALGQDRRRRVAARAGPEGRPRRPARLRRPPMGAGHRSRRRSWPRWKRRSKISPRRPRRCWQRAASCTGSPGRPRTSCCCRTRTPSPTRWASPTPMC